MHVHGNVLIKLPFQGQGANVAIEDAWTLAPLLATCDDESLDEWQKARIERVAGVAQLSMMLLNLRLPAEEQAKLPKEDILDTNDKPKMLALMKWLFGEGQVD